MLKKITFTGIDKNTDIEQLYKLARDYPKVEFGFLSFLDYKNTKKNQCNDPAILKKYRNKGLSLSLHVCGSLNDHLMKTGDWSEIKQFMGVYFPLFDRVQLNISHRFKKREDGKWKITVPEGISEVIIQQRRTDAMPIYQWYLDEQDEVDGKITILLDDSSGWGRFTGTPKTLALPYVGYAGGLNPGNVLEMVSSLEADPNVQNYWIDMQSGVRTEDDWFSVELCQKVCEQLKDV